MALPVVVIVGRPNVGKSTLFNRVIRRHQAVVDATPGVTRDRHYTEAVWNGVAFTLVDTGGYLPLGSGDELSDAVREQTLIGAKEADLIVFAVDAIGGLTDIDRDLAGIIHRQGTPTLLVANKVDDTTQLGLAWETAALGMGEPHPASAKTGFMFAEMLDQLVITLKAIKPAESVRPSKEELALAVIGAPNNGKSSLVNRLSGCARMVVSDIPGTTRDAVDTLIKYSGRTIRLIDTAGLKRKRFGQKGLEFYSTLRSLRALDRCDVAVVLLDATMGLTQGDLRLLNEAAEKGAGVILAVNKWDVVEKDAKSADEWLAEWRDKAPSLSWVPVLFISALTGQRAIKVIEYALEIKAERDRRIPTHELNEKVTEKLIKHPPAAIKGKVVRVKYAAQVSSAPPRFVFYSSYANLIQKQYNRYTERILRDAFEFRGVPIRIVFRNK